jgi:hypothetical protein
MNRVDQKPGFLGLAFLAGVAGTFLFALLIKPRVRADSRFFSDFPAYAEHDSGRLKSGML